MKVVLELQDQPSNVKKVTVRHDIVIGRGSDCNLRLSAPQISRRHCFLRVGREGVSVTDLDSSNGTFVDGKRLTGGVRQELIHGSVLALGAVRFLIRIKEDAVSEEVLKTSSPKHSSKPVTSRHSSDSSTVIGDADALLAGSLPPLARAMGMSVEQAGASADSHEVTADLQNKIVRPKAEEPSRQSSTPSQMDSNAKIVDRADFESSATIADSADLLEPEEFSSPLAKDSEPEPDMADAAPGDMSFFDDHEEDFGPASPQAAAELNAASHPEEAAVSNESAASDWDFAEFLDDEAEPVEVMEVEEVIDEVEEVAEPVAVDDVEVLDDAEAAFDDVELLDEVEVLDEFEVLDEAEVLDDVEAEVLSEPQALEVAEVIETLEATLDARSVHTEFADAEVLEAVDEVEMFEPEVLQDAVAADSEIVEEVAEIDPMDFLNDDFEPSSAVVSDSEAAAALPTPDAPASADDFDDFAESPVEAWIDGDPDAEVLEAIDEVEMFEPEVLQDAVAADAEIVEEVAEIDPMDFLNDDFEPSSAVVSDSEAAAALPTLNAPASADDFAESPVEAWIDGDPDAEVLEAIDEVEMFEPEVLQDASAADAEIVEEVAEIDPMDFLNDDFEPSSAVVSDSEAAAALPTLDAPASADDFDDFSESPVEAWIDGDPEELVDAEMPAVAEIPEVQNESAIAAEVVTDELHEERLAENIAADGAQFFDDVELFDDEDVVVEMVEEAIEDDDVEILASAEAEELSASEMQPEVLAEAEPEVVAEEPQVVEPEAEFDIVLEEIDDDASSWFAAGAADDDDADPELQKFLKGF